MATYSGADNVGDKWIIHTADNLLEVVFCQDEGTSMEFNLEKSKDFLTAFFKATKEIDPNE